MNLKLLFFYILLLVTIISCSKPHKDYVVKVKLLNLNKDDIYDKQLVYDVIFDSEELNVDSLKNKSRQLFLKGIDFYKNKKNPQKAISLFKSSILTFPEGKSYYELGNALLSQEALTEALKAYEVAEYLNFQPISKIYYNKACAYYTLYDQMGKFDSDKESYLYQSLSALEQAFNAGFTDTAYIKNDKRISQIISTPEYKRKMVAMIAEKLKNSGNGLFSLYLKSFPERTQPFEISLENVSMDADRKESISYDFADFIPEMENTSFGREVSHDYFYVAKVTQTAAYSAVVYSSISFYGEEMQPVHTNLVTYNNEGKIISKKMIACQCSAEKVKKVRIENNIITIEDFKRIWAKPITEVSFEDNKVDKYESLAKAQYRIEDSGHIVDENVPVNYNDSITFAKN